MAVSGLWCRGLGFSRHTGSPVLTGLHADFPMGAAVLISAPTGTGKSTLIHLLAGLLRPTSGEVWADGEPVSRWSAPHRDRWRRQVGLVFQHLHLLPDLSVMENVLLPCIPTAGASSALVRRADALLERLDLSASVQAPLSSLSGGERQRVAVARAFIGQPRFLLLDEPTSFQDDAAVARLLALLSDAAAQGACVVVCSHDVRLRDDRGLFGQTLRLTPGALEPHP